MLVFNARTQFTSFLGTSCFHTVQGVSIILILLPYIEMVKHKPCQIEHPVHNHKYIPFHIIYHVPVLVPGSFLNKCKFIVMKYL